MSDDFLFVINVLSLVSFCLIFFNKLLLGNTLRLTWLTIPCFFLVAYIIFMSVPSIFIYYDSFHPIRNTYFLCIQSVLITFPFGMFMANYLFRNPSRIIRNFLSSNILKTSHDKYFQSLLVLMIAFSIVSITIYISAADFIPLFRSFTDYGRSDGELVRMSIYAVPVAIQYFYALTVRFILPFSTILLFYMAFMYKGKWKYVYWFVLFLSIISSVLVLERSNIFGLFIMIAMAYYFKGAKKELWQICLICFIAMFLVGGLVSTAQYNYEFSGLQGIWSAAKSFLISRVFLDPAYMAYHYFEMFSEPSTFLFGRSIKILSLFGMEYYPIISPSFIAELWLNFGWFGVIIWPIIFGFILQFIQLKFFKVKTIPTLAGYILLALNGIWIIYGHVLATMVLSVYLLTLILLSFHNRSIRVEKINHKCW